MGSDGPFGPIVNGTQIVFFEHRPNQQAGYLFLGLFGLATIAHIVYMFRLHSRFILPLILGGTGEAAGYYGRGWASDDPNRKGPFILQFMLLLVSAPFIAATIYMSLGRIIIALEASHHSLISPRWMTRIYVLIDIACIFTQFIGAGMVVSGDAASLAKSRTILLTGLAVQIIALVIFIVTSWYVFVRTSRDPPEVLVRSLAMQWQFYFWAIVAATLAMIVRTVFRTIESLNGQTNQEAYIYIFDALPMFFHFVRFPDSPSRKTGSGC